MRLPATVGIEVPVHGLVHSRDGTCIGAGVQEAEVREPGKVSRPQGPQTATVAADLTSKTAGSGASDLLAGLSTRVAECCI